MLHSRRRHPMVLRSTCWCLLRECNMCYSSCQKSIYRQLFRAVGHCHTPCQRSGCSSPRPLAWFAKTCASGSWKKVGPKSIFHLSGAQRPKRAQNSWQDTYAVGVPQPKRGPPRSLFYSYTPPYYYIPQSFVQNKPKTSTSDFEKKKARRKINTVHISVHIHVDRNMGRVFEVIWTNESLPNSAFMNDPGGIAQRHCGDL